MSHMQGRFIAFFPTLAQRLEDGPQEPLPGNESRTGGVEQAIALQALAFRLDGDYRIKETDGTIWYYATWEQWHTELPFWSLRKVRRVFRDLRDRGLITVKRSRDYNFFTPNYRALVTEGFIAERHSGQSESDGDLRLADQDSQTGRSDHPLTYKEEGIVRRDTPIGPQTDDGSAGDSQPSPPTQPPSTGGRRNLTREVWTHFVTVMKPRRKDPTEEDLKTINAALKAEGDDVARIKRAIDGCYASDWHMGRDPKTRGRKYNTLSHILKGKRGERTISDTIEMFVGYAAGSHAVPSVSEATLQRWKDEVRARYNHPHDAQAVERGTRAERELADVGITVKVSGEGRGRKIEFEGP